MAVICYEKAGSCPTCNHFRWNPENDCMACFLKQDLSPAEYERYQVRGEMVCKSRLTKHKNVL